LNKAAHQPCSRDFVLDRFRVMELRNGGETDIE
jgi:hypothetical protein